MSKKEIKKRNRNYFGKNNPFYGKHHTEETNEKNRQAHIGKKATKEARRKMSEFQKGHPATNRNPIYKFKKGQKAWNKDTKGVCKPNSGSFQKGHKKNAGEKHGNWKGGISCEPYSVDWTKTLKKSIRERDKYTCQICGIEPAIFVHHIDYDKKNCNPNNLITLCASCHSKTNFQRDYWMNYFQNNNKNYE